MTATPSSTKTDAGASATLAKRLKAELQEAREFEAQYRAQALSAVDARTARMCERLWQFYKGKVEGIEDALAADSSRSTDSGAMERLAAKVEALSMYSTVAESIEEWDGTIVPTKTIVTIEKSEVLKIIAETTKPTADTSSKAGESE